MVEQVTALQASVMPWDAAMSYATAEFLVVGVRVRAAPHHMVGKYVFAVVMVVLGGGCGCGGGGAFGGFGCGGGGGGGRGGGGAGGVVLVVDVLCR
jgi:hypothetical protein